MKAYHKPASNYIIAEGTSLAYLECQEEDLEFDQWCDKVIGTLEMAKTDFK